MKTETISRSILPALGGEPMITELPNFDYKNLSLALQDTQKVGIDGPSSLAVAANLAYYNFRTSPFSEEPRLKRTLDQRLGSLRIDEQEASDNENLPTVGVEVEVPDLPFAKSTDIFPNHYRYFFDSLGMPRNRIYTDIACDQGNLDDWEFSPAPSHSASVQSRIISELVQGRFVPSLANSQRPGDIESRLGSSLVSLHVNIGVPKRMPSVNYEDLTEMKNLGVGLALAYSSGKRLELRKMKNQNFVIHKSGIQTHKTAESPMRLELKAMELRTALTYRALYTSQLMFSALFESKIHPHSQHAQEWKNVSKKIQDFLFEKKYTPVPTSPTETSYEVARIAQRGVGPEIRGILETSARRIRRIIQLPKPQSLPAE